MKFRMKADYEYIYIYVGENCFSIQQLHIRRRFETLIDLRKRQLEHYSEFFTKKL